MPGDSVVWPLACPSEIAAPPGEPTGAGGAAKGHGVRTTPTARRWPSAWRGVHAAWWHLWHRDAPDRHRVTTRARRVPMRPRGDRRASRPADALLGCLR